MSNPRLFWPDERIEQLKKLHRAGLSCSQIAVELNCGLTRNAIIGKIHRLGLSPPPAKPTRRECKPPAPKAPRVPTCKVVKPARSAPFAGSINIPFGDLRQFSSVDPNQCRFIEQDSPPFLYCGAGTLPGASYCAHHHALTHYKSIANTEADRARRKAHTAKVWFGASVKLIGAPVEAA